MDVDYGLDTHESRLIIEYRENYEEVSPQWLYTHQEAQSLVRNLHALLREFEMQQAVKFTLVQGHITKRSDFLSGFVSLCLQVYPANAIRVTGRVSTVVFTDEGLPEGCSF